MRDPTERNPSMSHTFPNEDSALDSAIAAAYANLAKHEADTDEYRNIVNQLTALYKIKNTTLQHFEDARQFDLKHQHEVDCATDVRELNERPFYARVDPNTALTVAANLVIGFAVIKYEHTGVIATRVRDFMKKI
jgi:hypothetical protein